MVVEVVDFLVVVVEVGGVTVVVVALDAASRSKQIAGMGSLIMWQQTWSGPEQKCLYQIK